MPLSVVSKNRSSEVVSAWPRTNWRIGESSPGIGCSANCAFFESVYSVGLKEARTTLPSSSVPSDL